MVALQAEIQAKNVSIELGPSQTEIVQGRLSKEEHPLGAPQEGHGCAALEEAGHHDQPEEGYGRPAAQEIQPRGQKQRRQVREKQFLSFKMSITMFGKIFMPHHH